MEPSWPSLLPGLALGCDDHTPVVPEMGGGLVTFVRPASHETERLWVDVRPSGQDTCPCPGLLQPHSTAVGESQPFLGLCFCSCQVKDQQGDLYGAALPAQTC